ncbi:Topoisomerase 1-associated factor 1 [Orbilia ellipsospora]|uniref:Topoisomerase 1-associated factor 1 n=1 Tax=Orbilia ellipsospora TaxID=2528407 RepID=A0AAV9XNV8_9PEZI
MAGIEAIDPSLRAHIYGLVSALGGPPPDDTSIYLLGDDVLGCLRDIKRWLKGYDEKLNRLDVARCLSESNIVAGDLLEILSHPQFRTDSVLHQPNKIGLACIELLVPLTWPLDKTELSMTVNHHRHITVLRRSQMFYKQAILTHRSRAIIKICCINSLPSMTLDPKERTARDEGIIRLVLYFIRNIIQIEIPQDESEELKLDVSKSSVIDSLDAQGVFSYLATIVSGIPDLFGQQDTILLEVIFHLLRGIKVEQLALPLADPTNRSNFEDPAPILSMLRKEEELKTPHRNQSRHNRFGTTVVIHKENGQKAVVSGQGGLLNEGRGLQILDTTKKWKRPQYTKRNQNRSGGYMVHLTLSARESLQRFLIQILQGGFSSLFCSVRKAIERDSASLIETAYCTQLFYVGATLIEFGRAIRQTGSLQETQKLRYHDYSSLLHAETVIILFKHLRGGLDLKAWEDIESGCYFFTQLLFILSEMLESEELEIQQVSENIFNRLFYEETLQDLMVTILRSGRGHSISYLDTVTEMIYVYLRCLERYSKPNSSMLVKSKRVPSQRDFSTAENSESDEATPHRPRLNEKQFDFIRCESKFLTSPCLETFLEFLQYYKELNVSQIKRCVGFLHRFFVKRGETIGLFHLRTILLLHNLTYDTRNSLNYSEAHIFTRYFGKQLGKKLADNPAMFVELLFHKSNKTSYFLQHGKERHLPVKKLRLPPLLEMSTSFDKNTRIRVAVSLVLRDEKEKPELGWIETAIQRTIQVRQEAQITSGHASETFEDSDKVSGLPTIVIKFDNDSQALLHLLSNRLQLLMRCLDFTPEGTTSNTFAYILSDSLSTPKLLENMEIFVRYKQLKDSELEIEDELGKYVKTTKKQRVPRNPETSNSSSATEYEQTLGTIDDEGFQFPDNLRSIHRKKRKRATSPGDVLRTKQGKLLDESEARARREERHRKERERRMGIKSSLYIASSDDDSDVERDREFLENERKLREAMEKVTADAASKMGTIVDSPVPFSGEGMHMRQPKRVRTMFTDPDDQSTLGMSDSEESRNGNISDEELE